ncbi:hypothetical protein FOCC_FOCC007322 [Frankliniella occidentalis]|nr:hypothetical protein FOCC_FOCC007322 [Frankliniella occidentalis]
MYGNGPIEWRSKKRKTVARSSSGAEYVSAAQFCAEMKTHHGGVEPGRALGGGVRRQLSEAHVDGGRAQFLTQEAPGGLLLDSIDLDGTNRDALRQLHEDFLNNKSMFAPGGLRLETPFAPLPGAPVMKSIMEKSQSEDEWLISPIQVVAQGTYEEMKKDYRALSSPIQPTAAATAESRSGRTIVPNQKFQDKADVLQKSSQSSTRRLLPLTAENDESGDEESASTEEASPEASSMGDILDGGMDVSLPPHRRCACHLLNLVATVDLSKALDRVGSWSIVLTKCKAFWSKQRRSAAAQDVVKAGLGKIFNDMERFFNKNVVEMVKEYLTLERCDRAIRTVRTSTRAKDVTEAYLKMPNSEDLEVKRDYVLAALPALTSKEQLCKWILVGKEPKGVGAVIKVDSESSQWLDSNLSSYTIVLDGERFSGTRGEFSVTEASAVNAENTIVRLLEQGEREQGERQGKLEQDGDFGVPVATSTPIKAEVVDNSSIVVLNTVDEEAMEELFRCVAVPADGMGVPIIRVLTDYVMLCQNKYLWAGVDLNKMQPFFELKGTNSRGNSAKVRMSRDELRVLCEKDIQDFIAEGIRKGELGDFIDCGGLRLTIVNLSDKKQMFNVRIRRKDLDTQCIDLALKSWERIFYFKKYIEYLANQKKEAIPVIIRLIQQLSKEAAEIFFEEGHGFAYLNKENEVQIVKFKEECSDFNVEVFNQLGDVDFKKVRFEIRYYYYDFILNYWAGVAGVWTDMVMEQDIMCTLKSQGGPTSRGLTESGVTQWVGNRPAMHKVTTALEGYCGLKRVTSEQHVDLGKSRVSRDQADRQRLVSWLEAHNPFDNSEGIRCISTGVRGIKEVNC